MTLPAPRSRFAVLRRVLLAGVGLLLAGGLLLLSCVSFERDLTPEQAARVARAVLDAPTGRLSTLTVGTPGAPRVLLVHGTPGSATDWLDLLLAPPEGLELLAVDRPGFGESAPAGAVTALSAQSAALAPLLVERDGRWPIVVGHSLGAPIALRLAADYPGRVGGLVLLAGALDPAQEEWQWFNRVAVAIGPLLSRPLRNSNAEIRVLRRELEALAPDLARVTCPVVVVHGRLDALVPFANVDYARRMLAGAAELRVVELPEGDHFLPWNAGDVVREAITSLSGR
jgi:pimeloyl-ACP methyl ester carboxylesterase